MDKIFNLYQYTKLPNLTFSQCCNALAEAAKVEGPTSLVGQTDETMPWRNRAADYAVEEKKVLQGHLSQAYQLVGFDNEDHLMLNNKSPLLDRHNNVVGIIGSSIDMSRLAIFHKQKTHIKNQSLVVVCGGETITLTRRETVILKWILRGKMSCEIALLENRSKRTIEGHIVNLKQKLQAQTKGDIIYMAHQLGLLYLTF